MDIVSAKEVMKSALDFHNNTLSPYSYAAVASFLVYKRVSKKLGVFISAKIDSLTSALSIQSNTLDGHSKKLEEHAGKIKNHEIRIGNLETKPKGG